MDGEARPDSAVCHRRALSCFLGMWLEEYPEDFCLAPNCLRFLAAFVQLAMPGSDLERRTLLLLAQMEQAELPEAQAEGEEHRVVLNKGGPAIQSAGLCLGRAPAGLLDLLPEALGVWPWKAGT